MKRILFLLVASLSWGLSLVIPQMAHANGDRILLVLGVIASSNERGGVALLKNGRGETFAARGGQELERGLFIERITRDFVDVRIDGRVERLKVGEELSTPVVTATAESPGGVVQEDGFERQGGTVKVTAAYRDHVVKNQLATILMQAAATPHYVNGQLIGFRLSDLEPGSIFIKAGFVDGDVVTGINGQSLSDVASTVRLLHSLKQEAKADVTLVRGGREQTMQIVVQ